MFYQFNIWHRLYCLYSNCFNTFNFFRNDPVKVRKDVLIQRLEKMSKLYEQYFKEMGIEYFNPFTSLNHFVSDVRE